MKAKELFKKHFFDGIVLLSLIVITIISFVLVLSFSNKSASSLKADIYRENTLLRTIDLSKVEKEESFVIEGSKGEMVISIKHNAIKVEDSSCYKKYCVHEGWVDKAGHPIICAYNSIYIYVGEASFSDVDI